MTAGRGTARRGALAVLAALTMAPGLAAPAAAQYYREEYDYRPRRPPPPDYGYDRPRYRDDYGYSARRRFGRICVTARGDCPTRPGPLNTPCGCEIPGFGFKRGAIGG